MPPDNSCGFCWPLLDPNEEDRANQNEHECLLGYIHEGNHRCRCGEEAPEVLPDAMVWSPEDDYCILCGGPCRQTALWHLASKKLGEQMDRMLEEMRSDD